MGQVDILINNAGLGGTANVVDMTDEQWHMVLDITLTGTFRMTRAMLPPMMKRKSGVIVNVSSITGVLAVPNQIAYSASKHALEAASEALAHEVYSLGIRVAIVEPGVAPQLGNA